MITLPNDCNCSELTVTPKDWKTCKASAIARNWHIQYYFYDTAFKKRKFVLVKGMRKAYDLLKLEGTTLQDIKSSIKFFEIAAIKMGIERMEIQSVKRRHLRQILETSGELKRSWSVYRFQHLQGLFNDTLQNTFRARCC